MKKKLSVIISLILIISLMTGCTTFNNFKNAFFSDESAITNVEENKKTIKIGVYEPLTGAYKTQGTEEKIGIELAHELYPEVLGRQVELVYADNQGDMYVAETVIKELVAQNPAVILGSYGETVTLVAGDAVREAQIPSISLTGTNALITVNNPYYFLATFNESRQGYALADFICKENNIGKVATVRVVGDDTVTATVQRFNSRVKSVTGDSTSVVGNYQLTMEETNFSETIEKIKNSGAQAVFLALSPVKAQEFLKQVKEAGLENLMYVGTNVWNDEKFLSFLGEQKSFDIAYTTDYAVDANTTKMSETFITAYKNKYGTNAEPTVAMAIAFDGYLMAIEAIQNAYDEIMSVDFAKLTEEGELSAEEIKAIKSNWMYTQEKGIPTGAMIREALTKINDFEGASGYISFNGTNEADKTAVINHNVNGEVQVPTAEEDIDGNKSEESQDGSEGEATDDVADKDLEEDIDN
ncbi:MAG: ABC transporter substrate-binding protein [Firmicutes bacterium]|nr:ABC transporter substrate-binding protein [Bacillota bacterium]